VTAANFITTTPPFGYQGFVQEGDGLLLSDTPKRGLQRAVAPISFRCSPEDLEGRALADTDAVGHPLVAVINASLRPNTGRPVAARKRVQLEKPGPDGWVEIVGVVADTLGLGNQPQVVDGLPDDRAIRAARRRPGFHRAQRGAAPDEPRCSARCGLWTRTCNSSRTSRSPASIG